MRIIISILILLFLLLQYEIWGTSTGVSSLFHLKTEIAKQKTINKRLQKKNAILLKNIQNLRHNKQTIEATARNELGMIKKGEVFYQIIDQHSQKRKSK